MLSRLRALPVLALVLGAADTLAARAALEHRPAGLDLFGQAVLVWLALGLIALLPSWLAARAFRRLRARRAGHPLPPERPADAALSLAAWMVLPVALHARLDRYTDLGGNLSGLAAPRPWLEALAIAIGVAVAALAIARLLRRVPPRAAAIAACLLALAAGTLVSFHRELPGAAGQAPAGAPNLLLMVWDTTRAKSLSPFGYDRETTPSLARLGEESVLFDEARSATCYTLSSHLSMLTGLHPSQHGSRMMRPAFNASRTPSIAQRLRQAGWRTGAFVGTDVLRASTGIDAGFETFDDEVDPPVCATYAWSLVHDLQSLAAEHVPALRFNGLPHWIQDFQRPAGEVLARAEAWLRREDPRPWFCMVNLYDPHWPYLPSPQARERWVGAYEGPVDGYSKRGDGLPPDYVLQAEDDGHLSQLYDAELWALDREVEHFLAALDLGAGRTALVLVSDHGEAFGEGGRYEHSDILECQVRVPLVVRPAGRSPQGRRSSAPAGGVDVAATLLELAGLPQPAGLAGRPLLAAPEDEPRAILVEDRDHFRLDDVRLALYELPWKLVRRGLGESATLELFDLSRDPEGLADLAAREPERAAAMARRLDELRASWGADDRADAERAAGGANLQALRGLGYIGHRDEPPQSP
ncbi:MAG TPA: sulfatase [Planctomycetota bacterium]|nr:sulfatase [Planctomycetota bacterium]